MPIPPRPSRALVLAALLGCGDAPAGTSFATPTTPMVSTAAGETSADTGTSTGTSTSTTGDDPGIASTAASTDEPGGPRIDGGVPDFGDGDPVGCQGKIDFLFIISSAPFMETVQQRLLDAFPDFITTIEDTFTDFDIHLAVTDGDAYWAMQDCAQCGPDCDPAGKKPYCGAQLDICDKKLGAATTYPFGAASSNRRCPLADDYRYITSADPDLLASFECLARVGVEGGDPSSAAAMMAALEPQMNAEDACNEGFLRDDALLVVVMINSNGDGFSPGPVSMWVEALQKAKHGDDDAFAVLVITSDSDLDPSLCFPEQGVESPKGRLRILVESIDHGYIGSICEKSYGPFFAEAAPKILEQCDGFIVPQ